ncbi:aldo/keto reductase [Ktedonobacter racemifer]|uniref:Aldo/keto reductase n=1 Tax=Ktedonobacter racemifer DSM 44963 TaxID=485913 RepID=D6TTN1_KTERA|nr:aldo/keto reductase [Ktedonobacter racemifer]EFH83782.1 aldo/keto reductase [Ktedonobacter racemifer DSM 44963]
MSAEMTRTLGRSGIEVSALGMGCWAIGGPFWAGDLALGYGKVDDAESIRAIQRALDLGVTLFDTAGVYGCGHSERILGQALGKRRADVLIATKVGDQFDEETRRITGGLDDPRSGVRRACEGSLRRLQTDYIDLYQLHFNDYDLERAVEVREEMEQLVAEGKIRYYGWSTDDPERASLFAHGPHCTAIQHTLNVFEDNPAILAVCEEHNLASINRGPLAMGVLTGKYTSREQIGREDIRLSEFSWNYLNSERLPGLLQRLDQVREVLTSDGRTLAQGALGWLWARSGHTIPIPGFKTVKQIEENAAAMQYGPLNQEQMRQIGELLGSASGEVAGRA